MKKSKKAQSKNLKIFIKITSIIFGLAGLSIAIYFVTKEIKYGNPNNMISLKSVNIQYHAKVEHIKNISEQEALQIKNGINKEIKNKMNSLKLKEGTDYQISENINNITKGINLSTFAKSIKVNSIATSNRTSDSSTVLIKIQEDISNRKMKVIEILESEAQSLSAQFVEKLKHDIISEAENTLNQGQFVSIDKDFQIINRDLIIEGAKLSDFQNKIKIKGISNKLTGEFPVIFEIK